MKDLKLTTDHDLEIVNGDLVLVTKEEEVAQAIKIALLTVQGEWVYDQNLGIPWFDDMYQPRFTKAEILRTLRARINDVPGVLSVNQLEMTIDANRQALVTFDVQTIYGTATDEVYI